tara:strand:+ start:10288 stop:11565 length:1278 start_codon:yes stop_codon:yes gene_type:complete
MQDNIAGTGKGKVVFITFIFFCLLFSFKVPVFYNSVILSGVVLLLFSITNLKRAFLNTIISSSYVKIYLFSFIGLVFLVLIYGMLHFTADFSRLNSVTSNAIVLAVVLLFCNYLSCAYKNKQVRGLFFCSKYIYYAFSLQSLIIIFAIISPSVLDVVQVFQSPADAGRAEKYEGIRGLALSGAQFFPLSAVFTLGQLFSVYYLAFKKKLTLVNVVFFFLIILAGTTAGRTSLLGALFSLILLCILSVTHKEVRPRFIKILIIGLASLCFLFVLLLSSSYSSLILDVYLPFAFEFIYSYVETGKLSTSSTVILSKMYWSLPLYELTLGYGYYRNDIGNPFMGTDGGYMRNVLFFGALGVTYVVLAQLSNIYLTYRVNRTEKGVRGFLIVLLFLIFLLHYKGEVLLHLVSIQTALFLIFFIPLSFKK